MSICTPTFNRRPFIPYLIKCVQNQTYPADRIDWVVVDDGTDPVEDLFLNLPRVRYFRYSEKMSIGKKRNITNEYCMGSIIIYMDDDDYYPPTRVIHAVSTLINNPSYLLAGCLQMPMYFHATGNIYLAGPYGDNRITAATFAFRRELLDTTSFIESEFISEEREFLKNYTIPVIPLDPEKTILVLSHPHNTINKEDSIHQPNPYISRTTINIEDVISDPDLFDFYVTRLCNVLENYECGKVSNKPDVLISIKDTQIKRLTSKIKQLTMENDRLTKLTDRLRALALNTIVNKSI